MSTQETASPYASAIATQVREKYHYFLIGFTVIVVLILALMNVFTNTGTSLLDVMRGKPAAEQAQQETTTPPAKNTYRVQAGDHLWKIAQQKLGTGYKAYDIARLNNIAAPYVLAEGQELILPVTNAQDVTTTEQSAPATQPAGEIASGESVQATNTSTTYAVVSGDSLWNIAKAAYGDGNMWTKIAEANSLVNPQYIHAGNTLTIPR